MDRGHDEDGGRGCDEFVGDHSARDPTTEHLELEEVVVADGFGEQSPNRVHVRGLDAL